MKTKLLTMGLGALGCLAAWAGEATHLVKSGETLWSISRGHGVSVEALRELNGLRGNVIVVGASLEIPGSGAEKVGRHTVAPGENLFRIGKLYDVPVRSLMEWNDLVKPEDLRAGSVLTLKGDGVKAEVPEPVKTAKSKAKKVSGPDKPKREQPEPDLLEPLALKEDVRYGALAERHGTTVSQLNELNGWSFLKNDLLSAGTEVYVPR